MSQDLKKIKIYDDLLAKSWKNQYPKDSDTPKEFVRSESTKSTVIDSQNTLVDSQQTIMDSVTHNVKTFSPFGFFDFHDMLSMNRRKAKLQKANRKLKKMVKERNRKRYMEKNKLIFEEALRAVLNNERSEEFNDDKPILYDLNVEGDEEEKEYEFDSNQNSHFSRKSSLKSNIYSNFSSDMFE